MSEEDLKTPTPEAVEGADPAPEAAPEAAQAESPEPAPTTDLGAEPAPTEVPEDGLLGSTSDDDRKVQVQADWPEDWRSKLANGDEKLAKRLERFSDPSKVLTSWLAAEQKISSGEYKKGLDENASEEQVAEWRKSNGIPETPDDYALPEDYEWSDTDQEMFGRIFEHMHEKNATQDHVTAVAEGYLELVNEMQQQRSEQDKQWLQDQEDVLRSRLGDEYRSQVNLYKRALEDPDGPIPQNIAQKLLTARWEDGSRAINDADMAQFVIELGLNHYGEGSLISGDAKTTMTNRLDEIRQVMRTDYQRYLNEGLDKEFNDILQRTEGRNLKYYDDDR